MQQQSTGQLMMRTPGRRAGRSRLLGGVSALAAAAMLLLAPQQASAQVAVGGRAFEANPTAIDGSVTITRTDTLDTVRVNSSEAVITWRPVDTATSAAVIDILPTGNALAFTGDAAYTVLNRVIPDDPTRAIQFNGTVISTVGGALGGNVWFYSPGGIIAGPSSVFLVGGLVLTSSTLNGIDKAGTELNFLGATAGSRIEVQPGAQLLAGNYLVLWAPRVVQGGGVAAGGNISYVGAEQGQLTVTGGLFDMVINVGTDDPNGVVHTGITTGPTPADNPVRAITMATVAKNDFVNMLVGGAVGYADASVATANNGIIVLSAANGTQPNSGNITIGPAAFNSTTLASASGDLTIDLDGQAETLTIGSATNESDFLGLAGRNLTINATSGATVTAFDNFVAQAAAPGQGGILTINVDDAGRNDDTSFSGLIVGGNLTLSAIGNGIDNVPLGAGSVGSDAFGGTININVSQGGELLVGGTTQLSAAAIAGVGSLASGNATGGAINFNLNGNNSRVQLVGNALFDVSANRSAPGPVASGGEVDAGSINLALTAGSFTFGNLTLAANADADDSTNASGRANGARGGAINIANTARLSGTGLTINARGLGGDGGSSATVSSAGGDGIGGTFALTNGAGGSLTLATLGVDVSGSGGAGGNGAALITGGRGGTGAGGEITLSNSGTLTGNPVLTLAAAGTGGNGGAGGATPNDFDPAAEGGAAGAGLGGTVNLVADGAAFAAQLGATVLASGTGGAGGTGGGAPFFIPGRGGLGGDAQGGEFYLGSVNGGALNLTTTTGTTRLDAGASGGVGGDGGTGLSVLGDSGTNGSSTGGTIELLAQGGALTVTGNLIADVAAIGNRDFRVGATGADSTGGTITTNAVDAGALTVTGGLWLDASAIAAIGEQSAGTGRGGTVNMLMSGAGSSFNVQGQFPAFFTTPPRGRALYVDTSAYEPQSGNPFLQTASGGDTFGGAINLAFTGGSSTINGRLDLRSFSAALNPLSGVGPGPETFIDNATATGGAIDITLTDSTHTWGTLDGSVTTFGFGGSAINGTVRATLDNATLNLVTTPGGNGSLSLDTYVAGEISQSDPDAVILRVLNGSTLAANGGISLFADSGHGISTNTITTGNVLFEVDRSSVSVNTGNIFLGNEAQAFRFPGVATNTTGADARAGDLTFRATGGSSITGEVQMWSFALADAGPDGGDARSGDLAYLLDGSTHTGNIEMLSFAEGQGASAFAGTGGTTTGGNQSISILNGADFTGDIDLETTLYTYHAGPAQGAFGDVQGGTASLVVADSLADIGVINVLFDGGADPAAAGQIGANIVAGSVSILASNGTVNVGDATVDLNAIGGAAGQNATGGTGTGGHILVTSDVNSALVLNDISFAASGTGGAGGAFGGVGGTGIGGAIGLFAQGDLELNSYFATATGVGGQGGAGDSGESGGDGGFGQGGLVELEISGAPANSLVLGNLTLDSSASGGIGGAGGAGGVSLAGGSGGAGGSAAGGTTRFRITGAGANLTFDPLLFALSSSALGGTGGAGGINLNGGVAGTGGDGGAGTGGAIALEAGSGATLDLQPVSAGPFQLGVTGTGGAGGSGGGIDMVSGGTAGAGGNGGQGTGGSPTLRAVGGLISVADLDIRATGIGGAGGLGGDDGTVILGATGNGGLGVGGTPLLETLDGSPGRLTLGTVVIDASGIGGGGTLTGSTAGGQITITDASADPAGLITMGSLTVTANGPSTPPGTPSLTIEGSSGPITVTGDVNASVAGDIAFVFAGNGQLAVGGSATLDAGGNIALTHTGNTTGLASLDIGTDLIATAGGDFVAGVGSIIDAGRDVSISAQNIQFASIAAVRDLLLTATNGDITAVGAAGLVAGRVLDLEATQAIAVGDVSSDLSIALTAGTSVTAGDVTSTGADTIADERISIVAGDDVSLGTVDAVDGLTITGAGLNATALDGQSVTATMTGAIDVGTATSETTIALSGTSIVLDNGDAPGNITLGATAGAIELGTINSETNLLATATGDISFGDLTGLVVTLDSGADIIGGTVAADRNIVSGVSRNVNLTAVGDVSITSASAVADVVVRGASFDATTVTSGTGLNDDIDVLVGGTVNVGSTSSGGQTVLNGSAVTLGSGVAGAGASVLTATTGAVNVGTFDSENFLDIVSATTVDFDTLTARAMSVTATGDVTGTRAATDVNLISGRPRNVAITTGGAVNVGQLEAIGDVVVDAASITSARIATQGATSVVVTGLADIDAVSTGTSATIRGGSLLIGDGVSGGLALLVATAGDVDLGTWDSEGFFDIDADGSVTFDRVTGLLVEVIAGGDITGNFAASDLNFISGRPRNVTLDAGGTVTIGEARSIGNVIMAGAAIDAGIVDATNTGTFTATGLAAIADLTTGGATTITAGSADVGVAATGVFTANTTGAFAVDALTTTGSTSDVNVVAGGAITLGTIDGSRIVRLNGASITGGTITAQAALDLDAGSVDLTRTESANGFITIDTTTGDVAVDDLVATNFGINVSSAGNFTSSTITAAASLLLDAAGDVSLGTANLGGAIQVDAGGNLSAGNLSANTTSPGITLVAGGNASLADLTSNGLINVNAGGTLTGGAFSSRGQMTLRGTTIDIASAITTGVGGIFMTSTTGDILADLLRSASLSIDVVSAAGANIGAIEAGSSARVTTVTDATLGPVTATGGQVTLNIGGNLIAGDISGSAASPGLDINVGGNAQLASITSGSLLDIDVGGNLTGDAFRADGNLTVDAATIAITSATSDRFGIVLRSTLGTVAADLLTAAGSVQVASVTGATLGMIDAGANIDVTAGGNTSIGGATADGNLTVTVTGDLVSGALAAGTAGPSILDLNVTGDAQVASAGSAFILDADIGGALTGGEFASGATTIDAASVDLTRVAGTAGGGVIVNATAGDAAIGIVDSGGNARINALAGAANVGTLNAALLGEVIARSVTVDSGIVGGNLRLQATAGDIAGNGVIDVGGAIDLDASGNIGFGTLDAAGGNFSADAGGDITFTGASALGLMNLTAGGSLSGGDVSGTFVTLDAGNDASVANVTATGRTAITAGGLAAFDSITSQLSVTINAGSIAGGDIATPFAAGDNNVTLATTGDMTLGDVTSGETTSLTAGGALVAGTIRSTATDGATITIQSQGADIAALIGQVAGGGAISVDGGAGAVDLGALVSGSDATVTGSTISLGSGDIRGNLSLTSTGGDISILLDGANQVLVGGSASLDSAGSILLTHTNNPGGLISFDVGGNVLGQAGNAISTGTGSILSGNEVFLLAGGNVDLADARAVPALVITAGGSVTLANATVTGPQGLSNVSGIRIDAGLDPRSGSTYDNIANARITGTVSSYAGIVVNAGGSAEFAAGSQALAGDRIVVRTGDDIIIGTGALLQSARDTGLVLNPSAPFSQTGAIDLHAGGLTPLLSIPSTPIASLVVDGSVDAGRGAVIARANAIDGIDGAFAGSSLSFDIDNAPADGAILSDDNGLLTAPCLEGNVCLGSIAASNLLHVGQASGNDVLALTIEQGTVNAREIRIATRNDIVMGTNGIATTLNASDLFTASSRSGDVDLRDAAISSNQILIEAAGSLLGSASLTSSGDIGITVGDSLFASVIDAGGELTSAADAGGALEGSYNVPGTLAVGSISLGAGPVDYSATTIDIGSLSAPGTDVRLVATGALALGQTSGVASLDLEGGSVVAGDLSAAGDISVLSATDIDLASATGGGAVSIQLGGNLSFGLIDAASDILASAGGAINGGDLTAPGSVTLDGARIAIGSATGGLLSLTSQSDVLFDLLSSPNSISVTATGGTIAGNTGSGLIETDGDLTLRARSIDLRDLTAGGTIDIAVTGTALTLGMLDAGRDIILGSAGSISVDHAEAVRHFTATAGTSFATGPNSIITGGDILIDAGGEVALGNSSAGGLIDVAGTQIAFGNLLAGLTVSLQTALDPLASTPGNGSISGQSITAGTGDSLIRARDGGDIVITGLIAADAVQVLADAGAITSGGLNTRLFANLTAAGAISLTGNSLGTNTFFADGASIQLGSSSITNGNVTLLARTGDITGTGAIDANGELVVSAARSASLLGDLSSASSIRIDAGTIALGNAESAGGIALRATGGGIASSGLIVAGQDISVDTAGGATFNELVAGDDVLFAGSGDISITRLLVTGNNPQSEEVGSNASFTIDGNVFIDHADVADNLVANVTGGFATGPNSIITGGDIVIDADGTVTLGNSSAGGLVDVTGSQIDFDTLGAGQTVSLLARPSVQSGFGNGNITGNALTAGPGASTIISTFGSVSIGGQTTVAGSLAVSADGDATFSTVAAQGGTLSVTAGNNIGLGSASASGNATLTAGQSIAATGDISSGGVLTLLAQAGNIAARDLVASGVNASAAGAITLRDMILAGGGASLISGGDVMVRDTTGAGAPGVSITADGSVAFEDIASGGGVSLLAEGGALTGTTITAVGAVALDGETVMLGTVSAAGDVFGIAESGPFTAGSVASSGGEVFLESAASVAVDSLTAATDITVQGGDIAVGSASAGRDIALASGAANGVVAGPLSAGGAISVDAGTGGFAGTTVDAGGNVAVTSGADASFAAIVAGGSATLVSTGNGNLAGTSITAGGDISATTGGRLDVESVAASQSGTGQVNLSAAQGISISTLVGNTAQLAASGGQVRVSVEIDVPGLVEASGQSVYLRSTRNLSVAASATAGDIDIETERDLDISAAMADAGNVRLVSSGGVASVGSVSAAEASPGAGGNVTIEAEENLRVAGSVSAANLLEMRAGERADINAAAVGRDIVLHASDVDIASTGSLGTLADTRSIEISGGGIARIGGDSGGTPGFIIDNSEFARIRSGGSIAISAGTAIILDDLDIRIANGSTADGNLRGEGRIDFGAAENIDIIGEVVMAGATADNAIGLSTGGDVFLDASTGLVEINNGSGTYLGAIEVEASNFLAMTEQARTDVAAATSVEAIDDRLAQNDGIDNPDGLIRTGTLDITTTTSNVFIQNTAPGTRFAERRGFTVDELLISDPAGTNQPIVINGIIGGATGVDAIPLAQISSTFDPGSTINGCLIANPAGCSEIPDNLGAGSFPIQDLIDDQLDDEEAGEPGLGSGLLETPLFELKDPLETSEDPLLDDPVTGAGNEDLWVGEQPGK